MWTGGRPVLGYDVVEKKLVVNDEEAERVRTIYGLYLELGSILAVIASMTMGFAATLALGTAVYFVGFAALTLRTDSSHSDLPVGSPTTAL